MLRSPVLANNFGSVCHFHAAIAWAESDTGAGLSIRVQFQGETCRSADKAAPPYPGAGNSLPRTKLFKPTEIMPVFLEFLGLNYRIIIFNICPDI